MTSKASEEIRVGVAYGLGATFDGRFARRAVQGLSARQLVSRVVECRQARGPATRTAAVVGEVLRSSRQVDVELVRGSDTAGQPMLLDDVVVPRDGAGNLSDTDDVTILLSEQYRGGAA